MFTLAVLIDLKVAVAGGALALGLAVFVYNWHRASLDQPKVRITASYAMMGSPDYRHYIVVRLTNAGRRPVTLTQVRFESSETTGLLVTHPDDPVFDAATCFPAKRKLTEGDQTAVYCPRNEFAEASSSPVKRFLAVDTTGKTWKSKKYPLSKSSVKPIPHDGE